MKLKGYGKEIILSCFLLALVSLFLTACVKGAARQNRTGVQIMNDYLASRGENSYVSESHTDIMRLDIDKVEKSDFVKGTFVDSGNSYEFAVNVVTGQIYTSERVPEFAACCSRILEERLGLDPNNCVSDYLLSMYEKAWVRERNEWPGQMTSIGDVLPVDIKDMENFASQAILDDRYHIILNIVCKGEDIREDRWNLSDTEDWGNVSVRLYDIGDSEKLPGREELKWDYMQGLSGNKVELSKKQIRLSK
ncbi:MAG: hypothetical protein K5989_09400 [Lachnospiraceae bacterium]|nr:hypothetical protein [Lachnospiraceae bacterium]